MLRLNLNGSIPADNPFVGQVGKRGEIYAYGFRNPFRFSFDPMTGNLWLGDVGDLTVEEVDLHLSAQRRKLARHLHRISNKIYHAPVNGARNDVNAPTLFVDGVSTPSDVIFGSDGALYYVAFSSGSVHRVAPIAAGGDEPVGGTKLTLKDNVNPEKKRLTVQSKDNIVLGGSSDDPTVAGGRSGS